jgi:hypothetical protein
MRLYLLRLLCVPLLLLLSLQTQAQNSIAVPSDSKFVLQVDLQALRHSKVGASLMEMAKKAAMEEMGNNSHKGELSQEKIKEVVGFDPFEDVQGIVICASDFEHPEKSMLGMVRLKQNTGNIEGLLLSLPGYEKSDHGKYEIHSADPSDDAKLFGAIHKNAEGNHTLIVGAQKKSVTNLLDSLDSAALSNQSLKTIGLESDRKVLASMQVLQLPTSKELGKGPQANIAALLSSLVLSVLEEDDELEVRGAMQAGTEKQADKICQSIKGLSAMIELAASLDEDADEDMQQALAFLKQVKVTQNGSSVKVLLRLPSAQITEMIKKEMSN